MLSEIKDRILRAENKAIAVSFQVMGFVVAAVMIMVGVVIFYNVQVALPTSTLPASAQTIISNVGTTGGSGFNLLTVALIVIAAGVIIGVLFSVLMGRSLRGGATGGP